MLRAYDSCLQIRLSDVDFWAKGCGKEDMELQHKEGLYPPRVTVNWIPAGDLHERCSIPVTVTGCVGSGTLDSDIVLPLG